MISDYNLENFSCRYGSSEGNVINDISAGIPKGKITALFGESGCGKSTLIFGILGIIPEHFGGECSGKFYSGDKIFSDMKTKELSQDFGFVFQNPESQFCTYSVEDEIAFGMENLCFTRERIEEGISDALNMVGISHLRKRLLHELSGGEKQLVAIASVLATDPSFIIVDEPTANLDPSATRQVFECINRLNKEYSKTFLVVEHKLEYCLRYIDYILVLSKAGTLLFGGQKSDGIDFLISNKNIDIHLPPELSLQRSIENKTGLPLNNFSQVANYLNKLNIKKTSQKMIADEICKTNRAIEFKNISYSVNNKNILNNVSFTVNEGDFFGIVGHNGAGKTTIINTILQIYTPSSGDFYLYDKPAAKMKRDRWRSIGVSFQNPEWQFVANTVEDEVLYSLKKVKISSEEKNVLCEMYLRQFGLYEKRKINPYLLSEGQKRRLSVASVLVLKQKILILDEPTFGQDAHNQKILMEMMKKLNDDGLTIIIVTHDMNIVYEYCNRVVAVSGGQIIFDGNSSQLFSNDDICIKANLIKPFWYNVSQEYKKISGISIDLKCEEDVLERFAL